MRTVAITLAFGLAGQAAAFTQGVGRGSISPTFQGGLAESRLGSTEQQEKQEGANALPRLALGAVLGLIVGLAAASAPAAAKQPFQSRSDLECPIGNPWDPPPCRFQNVKMGGGWEGQSPGALKRPTADSGVTFKYGPDSKFGNGYMLGEQVMNKDGDADGPETRFFARRPDKIAMAGGYYNYMGMANDAEDPKRKIRSRGAGKTYLTEADQPTDPDELKMVVKQPVPKWGITKNLK